MTADIQLHVHPTPPIAPGMAETYSPLAIIAAGLGWPIVKANALTLKREPSPLNLAHFIVEGASGTHEEDSSRAIVTVKLILDDLPRSVWNRLCDLLHEGRPDAALRVIQCHHNVVRSLTDTAPPEPEEITGTFDDSIRLPRYTGEKRSGYYYIEHDGNLYGPVPVNKFTRAW